MSAQIIRPSNTNFSVQGNNRFRNGQEVSFQRFPPLNFFQASPRRLRHRKIRLECLFIRHRSGGTRKKDVGRRIRGVVLFSRTRPFIFRLFRRTVRGVCRAINLLLPRVTWPTARILFSRGFRAATSNIRQFRSFPMGRGGVRRRRRRRYFNGVRVLRSGNFKCVGRGARSDSRRRGGCRRRSLC